ncbi:MAG: NADH-quinone oxidoreductase subunit NuoE [Firmicutes bacterium]|nr:NADH-quinone oxidoreductase subunit NuoE [Bacillota bacterium]
MTIETKKELTPEILEFIETCKTREHPDSYLIAVLHKVQGEFGYLSRDHMDEVAHLLGIPTAYVFGVATFYHFFRLKPQGRYSISVCLGTACFVKGADRVLESFKNELGIEMGETTKDGVFSLTNTRCLGVCGLAPVVMVNDKVYGQVTPQQVPEILNRIRTEIDSEADQTDLE